MSLWDGVKRVFRGRNSSGLARMSKAQAAQMSRDIKAASAELRSYAPQDLLSWYSSTPAWSNFSTTDAITNSLEACVWVGRCIQICSMATASVPVVAEQKAGDTWVHEPDSPLQRLIDRPNNEWSWPGFASRVVAQAKLSGESYITKLRSEVGERSASSPTKGQPIAMWAYLADRFAPRKGNLGGPFVTGYKAEKPGLVDVAPDDMLHFKLPHPDDDWHGLAELTVTSKEVDTDVEASKFQKLGLQNRAIFDGILSVEDGELNDAQWEATNEAWASRYAGGDNARKILVLQSASLKWTDMAKSSVDLDFIEGRKLTREGICAGFGVPPVLVGILDRATYSNFSQAELVFWKFTILPFLDLFIGDLNMSLAPEFGAGWRIRYDVSRVDALFQLYVARQDAAIALRASSGMPWIQLNERFSLGLSAWPGWEDPAASS